MIEQFLTRLAATMASLVVAMLVFVAALAFLAYAAYLALLGVLSPPLAALATGAGAIFAAFLIVALARVLTRPRRARRRERADDTLSAERLAGEIGGKLSEQIGALTRTHKGPVLAASLLAGVAVGASPRLRGALLNLVLPR